MELLIRNSSGYLNRREARPAGSARDGSMRKAESPALSWSNGSAKKTRSAAGDGVNFKPPDLSEPVRVPNSLRGMLDGCLPRAE